VKRCSKCGEEKSLSEFCIRLLSKDNLAHWCRKCESIKAKKYYQIHKAKRIECAKKYYQTNKIKCNEHREKYRHTFIGCLRNRFSTIKRRCNNPKVKDYERYGERGIRCLFKSFNDFFNHITINLGFDTYEKIKGLQIDRIDNNSHYEKGNIRFVTAKENCNNRRKRS